MTTRLLKALPLALACALFGVSWGLSPNFSASAVPLLSNLVDGVVWVAPLGALLTTKTLIPLYICLGIANLILVVLLSQRAGIGRMSLWLPLVLLSWGSTRALLTSVNLEAWLLLACQLTLFARPYLVSKPAIGSALLGCGWALALMAGPQGLLLAPFVMIVGALPASISKPPPQGEQQGIVSAAVVLPWLAAGLLAFALLYMSLPNRQILLWWKQQLVGLRAAAPTTLHHGVGDWLVVGPLLVRFAMMPAIALLLAWRWGQWSQWCLWTGVVVASCLYTGAAPIDTSSIGLCLFLIPCVRGFMRATRHWDRTRRLAMAACLFLGLWADNPKVASERTQSALATALPISEDVNHLLPAVLTQADLDLLNQAQCATRMFPSRRGARQLSKALHKLRKLTPKATEWDAFTAQAILVRKHPQSIIGRGWSRTLERRTCGADSCLLELKERTLRTR
ncbi:MAG TPA: hypothetical protein DCQ06_14015 [Myxococcales bacterium]|nr:hypothetical protein [Myxococcales bacterium]